MILTLALAAHVSLAGLAASADLRGQGPSGTPAHRAVSQEAARKTGSAQPKERPSARGQAQTEGGDASTAQASAPGGTETKDEKGRKVIRIEELTIEGRIQKPQAFYILQRSQLNFEELNRSESFIPRVEKSVENAPF